MVASSTTIGCGMIWWQCGQSHLDSSIEYRCSFSPKDTDMIVCDFDFYTAANTDCEECALAETIEDLFPEISDVRPSDDFYDVNQAPHMYENATSTGSDHAASTSNDHTASTSNDHTASTSNDHRKLVSSVPFVGTLEEKKTSAEIELELERLIESDYCYEDPRFLAKNKHAYLNAAIMCISSCNNNEIFTNSILQNIKNKRKSRRRSSKEIISHGKINLSRTYSDVREYMISKITPIVLDISAYAGMKISSGMSMEDIRHNLLFNEYFFSSLSESCEKLGTDIVSTNLPAPVNIQTQARIVLGHDYIEVTISKYIDSEDLQKITKEMLARCVSDLPSKIYCEIKNVSAHTLRKWLFSNCHGIHVSNLFLGNISNICISRYKKILENKNIINSLDEISRKVIQEPLNRDHIIEYHILINQVFLHDYVDNLAKESINEIMNVLEQSVIFHDKSTTNLGSYLSSKIANHIVCDIRTMVIESYKRICKEYIKLNFPCKARSTKV